MGHRPSLDCSACGKKLAGGQMFLCSCRCDDIFREWERLPIEERPTLEEYYQQIQLAEHPLDEMRHDE